MPIVPEGPDIPPDRIEFAEASRRRSCTVMPMVSREAIPDVGTGTMLLHNDQLLVLTCHHNAADFYGAPLGQLGFFDPELVIPRAHVDLVYPDPVLDLAILRIQRRAASRVLPSLRPLSLRAIGDEGVYGRAGPGTLLHLFGFPAAMTRIHENAKRVTLTPMTMETRVLSNESDRMELDYEHGTIDAAAMGLEHATIPGTDLLLPHGMSGALVFDGRGFAIAMEFRSDEGPPRLTASPIHQLRELIEAVTA